VAQAARRAPQPNLEPDRLAGLVHAWSLIGPNARSILLAFADRLVIGREHGDFDAPHDWSREAVEEELDGAAYRIAKLLGLGQ
jgi:hypothetical protein